MCERCRFLAEAEALPLDDALGRLRDHLISSAVKRAQRNVREAARLLGCDRRVVQRWLAKRGRGSR